MASNYKNRSIDLVAFQGVKPVGYATLNQTLFLDNAGEICTGIQKLVQRWLCTFLTPVGSVTFDKNKGTKFMLDIYSATTEDMVSTMFLLANSDAIAQLKETETTDMPDDERIYSAKLDSIDLYLGNLSLYITITSAANTQATIILPIDTNPLML